MINFIKREKVSIIFALCFCALAVIACVARYFPTNVGKVYKPVSDAIATFEKEDAVSKANCEIESDGTYKITNVDPQICFSSNHNGIEALKVNFSSPIEIGVDMEIYVALEGEGFSEEKRYIGSVFKGDTSAIIDLPLGDYRAIRVDINNDVGVVFKNVELFDQQPDLAPYTPVRSTKDYVLVVIIPLICTVLAFFANKYLNICKRAASFFKDNFKTILLFLLLTAVALALAAFIEGVSCIIERQDIFSFYRWLFLAGVLEIAVVFILLRKWLADAPEKLFLPIVLILGSVMLFSTPIKHICWDFDSHYPWAVHTSYSDTAYITGSTMSIDYVKPHTLVNGNLNLESYKNDLSTLQEDDARLEKVVDAQFSIAHLPTGIVISIARMFGAGFSIRYNLGRITYLLIYAFVCYFAIKKIKSGKMILSTICLFPTALFMATNYAYASWVTAFLILGTAYFVSILQEPDKKISVLDICIMCGAFALASMPKLIYVLALVIPFFVVKKWENKNEKRKYYAILTVTFMVVFAFFALTSLTKVGGSGDARGGNVGPTEQIKYILSAPLDYTKILIKFLREYLSIRTMEQYISNFAYLGLGKWWPIFVMLLIGTALTDARSDISFKIPTHIRKLAAVFFIGMVALIATALYIDFNPIANTTISGCQPRYIIPLLAPTILLVTGSRKDVIKEKNIYNGFVLIAASAAVMMDIYTAITLRMI